MLREISKIFNEAVVVGRSLLQNNQLPPLSPAFALSPGRGVESGAGSSYDIQQIVNDMRILLGVPKYRTSKPKKQTRKFSYTRLLTPAKNLVSCQNCGNYHTVESICNQCYSRVREVTNMIKTKMMEYNPYLKESQDKPISVKYLDDPEIVNGKRIIEIPKTRNSWFVPKFEQEDKK
uniref:39S ribosomal protein L32, mitochondrial n=1 Tax=Rhabditophanes sp. KR3021 TaxID=114890 RepID=A0AC35TU10_9BILA